MKFKEFVLKRKKYLIACAVSLALGIGLGITTNPTQDEVDKLCEQKTSLENEYIKLEANLEEEKTDVKELKDKLANVEDKKEKKQEEIKLAKEAKEKEEAEKKAKEEEERKAQEEAKKAAESNSAVSNSQSSSSTGASKPASQGVQDTKPKGQTVWITATGSKYHSKSKCGNTKSSTQISLEEAQSRGYTACKKCF